MVRVNRVGAVWAGSLLCGLLAFLGCSESSSSNSCISYCDNLCSSLEACEVEVQDCRSSCETGLNDRACRGQEAPDRLTCAELTATLACADYCVALCDRAPDCGSSDSGACVNGCLEVGPRICNAASVGARTCDQIKPEIRLYESVGTPTDGDHAVSGGARATYGLCEDADDCEEPLGCSQQTNTCAPCKTNEDCAGPYGARVCNDAKECETVECLSDEDCSLGRPCITETHECGECREDADCKTSFGGACDVKTLKCVECKTDADCELGPYPSCDVAQQKCVECSDDSHCTNSFAPACDTATRHCVACNEDAHCAQAYAPACDAAQHECVECRKDAHCPEESPRCDTESQTCKECTSNADCGTSRPRCNTAALFCEDCQTNADCEGREQPFCTELGACGNCEKDGDCAIGEQCDTFDGTCVSEL